MSQGRFTAGRAQAKPIRKEWEPCALAWSSGDVDPNEVLKARWSKTWGANSAVEKKGGVWGRCGPLRGSWSSTCRSLATALATSTGLKIRKLGARPRWCRPDPPWSGGGLMTAPSRPATTVAERPGDSRSTRSNRGGVWHRRGTEGMGRPQRPGDGRDTRRTRDGVYSNSNSNSNSWREQGGGGRIYKTKPVPVLILLTRSRSALFSLFAQ